MCHEFAGFEGEGAGMRERAGGYTELKRGRKASGRRDGCKPRYARKIVIICCNEAICHPKHAKTTPERKTKIQANDNFSSRASGLKQRMHLAGLLLSLLLGMHLVKADVRVGNRPFVFLHRIGS
jgi:hypothetical protein